MTIDTDWQFKAEHWEREAKRLIAENESLKTQAILSAYKRRSEVFSVTDAMVNAADSVLSHYCQGIPDNVIRLAIDVALSEKARRDV